MLTMLCHGQNCFVIFYVSFALFPSTKYVPLKNVNFYRLAVLETMDNQIPATIGCMITYILR
jgi:hypothetical protein